MGAFVFSAEHEVDWPVTIATPKDGGDVDKTEISARLRLATGDAFAEIRSAAMQSMFAASKGQGATQTETERDRIAAYVLDWKGIETPDGEPIPCTDDTRKLLLDNPYIYNAFAAALVQASSGARAKN